MEVNFIKKVVKVVACLLMAVAIFLSGFPIPMVSASSTVPDLPPEIATLPDTGQYWAIFKGAKSVGNFYCSSYFYVFSSKRDFAQVYSPYASDDNLQYFSYGGTSDVRIYEAVETYYNSKKYDSWKEVEIQKDSTREWSSLLYRDDYTVNYDVVSSNFSVPTFTYPRTTSSIAEFKISAIGISLDSEKFLFSITNTSKKDYRVAVSVFEREGFSSNYPLFRSSAIYTHAESVSGLSMLSGLAPPVFPEDSTDEGQVLLKNKWKDWRDTATWLTCANVFGFFPGNVARHFKAAEILWNSITGLFKSDSGATPDEKQAALDRLKQYELYLSQQQNLYKNDVDCLNGITTNIEIPSSYIPLNQKKEFVISVMILPDQWLPDVPYSAQMRSVFYKDIKGSDSFVHMPPEYGNGSFESIVEYNNTVINNYYELPPEIGGEGGGGESSEPETPSSKPDEGGGDSSGGGGSSGGGDDGGGGGWNFWDWLGNVFRGLGGLGSGVGDFFKGAAEGLVGALKGAWDLIKGIAQIIIDGIRSLFMPPDSYDVSQSPGYQAYNSTLNTKFGWVEDLKQAASGAFVSRRALRASDMNWSFSFQGQTYSIDFSWYDPYRESIRKGLAVILTVGTAISIFRMFSSALGVTVSHAFVSSFKN